MTSLIGRIIELKELRAGAAIWTAKLKARHEDFDRENAQLIQFVRETAVEVDAAETALKAVALQVHENTGTKKPAPGVEIKMFKEYAIDEVAGLAWATEKQLCLIPARLDLAAIKKLATVTPLPFVLIAEVPKATIATDLSKLDLAGIGEPALEVTETLP